MRWIDTQGIGEKGYKLTNAMKGLPFFLMFIESFMVPTEPLPLRNQKGLYRHGSKKDRAAGKVIISQAEY